MGHDDQHDAPVRCPVKSFSGMMDTWDDANQAMRYWAKRVRYVNFLGSGRSNGVNPE